MGGSIFFFHLNQPVFVPQWSLRLRSEYEHHAAHHSTYKDGLHNLAIQSFSAPSRGMGRERCGHNQQNTGSHVAPGRGCRVVGIAIHPDAVLKAIKPAFVPAYNFALQYWAADWPIKSLPEATGSFLEGWYRTGNIPATEARRFPPHLGRIGLHRRFRNPSMYPNLSPMGT